MKSLLILITIFSVTTAYACPEVEGRYSCPDPRGGTTTVEIEQNGQEFQLRGLPPLEQLIADGQWQQVDDSSYYRKARYKAICQGVRILATVQGEVYQNNLYAGKAAIQLTLEQLPSGDLKRIAKGTIQGPFIQIPVADQAVCKILR